MEQTRRGRNLNIHLILNQNIIRLKVLIQSKAIQYFWLQRLYFVPCKLFSVPRFFFLFLCVFYVWL